MPPTSCRAVMKDYCANCTFAGVRYIADDKKHWIERWFWVLLVILSWCGSAILTITAWEAYVNNPISFGLETTYTKWNTKMPSVAVCETANDKMIYNVSDTIWPSDHLLELEDTLKDIAFFRGSSYNLLALCHNAKTINPLCPLTNFSYYAKLIRTGCLEFVKNCFYNNQQFDCCKYFQHIDTDLGPCFTINSVQTRNPEPLAMIINATQKTGVLRFELYLPSIIYTLSEEEVPTITTLQTSILEVHLGNKYRRYLSVRNIENDPLVAKTTVEQRACKFRYENHNGLYPQYSYSACTVRCRKEAQMELCQCYDHFMLDTKEEEHCNITGLACLDSHSRHLTSLKPPWATRPGLACDCVQSCDETEITVLDDNSSRGPKKKIVVEMVVALPTERFKRNVVRSVMDLVVSIGGTAGLFVGASLLSFVELMFYFTVRFFNNHLIEKRKRLVGKHKRRLTEYVKNNHQINKPRNRIFSKQRFWKTRGNQPFLP